MMLSVRFTILLALGVAVFGGNHAEAARSLRQGACSADDLVELYPGYPGFDGYLTGVRGPGRYACPDDLDDADPSFSLRRENAENRAAARELGIDGPMATWTWENWMAIEAERDMVPTCWSCALLNDDPGQPMPPAGAYNPDDPRLLIGDVYGGSNGVIRYLREHDLDLYWVDRLPNDYQIRAVVSLLSSSKRPNAEQMLDGFEEFLDLHFGEELYDWTGLWDRLIERGGYVPTPESAVPEVQVFTIVVGVDAITRLLFLHDMVATNLSNTLERTIDDWLLEVKTNPNAPSFADWMRDAGAEDWL